MRFPVMNGKNNKKSFLLNILFVQLIMILYSLASVTAKFASAYPFTSAGFILLYALEIFLLGIYAVLWLQVLKKVDLSIAYANRGTAIFWAMIWSALLFHETVTFQNLVGIIVVFCGITIVNSDKCGYKHD